MLFFGKVVYYFRLLLGLKDSFYLNQIGPDKAYQLLGSTTLISDTITLGTRNFLHTLLDQSQAVPTQPIALTIEKALQAFNLLSEINNHPDRLHILEAYKTLLRNAKDQPDYQLSTWLKNLRSKKMYNITLAIEPILFGEKDAVVVQTVHQAKGREYDTVFLPHMHESNWSSRKTTYFYLPLGSNGPNDKEDTLAEERRLLYVGLTRAKRYCFLSYAIYAGQDSIEPSRFLFELPQDHTISDETVDESLMRTHKQLQPAPPLTINDIEESWLKTVVADLRLSPTSFCSYHKCPKNFLLRTLLRVPVSKSPSQAYGTAIHSALEHYFRDYMLHGQKPSADVLLTTFESALNHELLTEKDKQEFITQGTNLLSAYYATKQTTFVAPIATEFRFHKRVTLDDIPLTGQIDKIEWVDPKRKHVRVIDYKTGRAKTRNALLGKTKNSDRDYYDQLLFYKILGDLDPRFSSQWQIVEGQIQFLDDEHKFTTETFEFDPEEIKELKNRIKDTWQKIQALDFPHDINNPWGCDYCATFL